MSPSSHVEIERKYDVDESAEVPDVVGVGPIAVVEPVEVIELDAIYFDTADFLLAQNRTALRRRSGGDDAGWHIKRVVAEGRTELHWPLGDNSEVVPAEIRSEVRDIVRDGELRAIARVHNRRENRRLLDAAGYPVAEVSDDHVAAENLIDGSRRKWREWEVELLAAAPDSEVERTRLLDAIEGVVIQGGARVSLSSSKVARALGIDAMTS